MTFVVATESIRPTTGISVREAVWGGPRDDAEFVACELLAATDESTDRTLDEFFDEEYYG